MVLSQTLEREGERGGKGWTSAGFQFIKKSCWCFRPQIRATVAINLTHPFHHGERQTALIAVISPGSHTSPQNIHSLQITTVLEIVSSRCMHHTVHNTTFDCYALLTPCTVLQCDMMNYDTLITINRAVCTFHWLSLHWEENTCHFKYTISWFFFLSLNMTTVKHLFCIILIVLLVWKNTV